MKISGYGSSVVVSCLMLLGMVVGCQRQIEPPLPIAVQVTTLKREVVVSETRFTATVRERQRIELSFKVPGTLSTMLQVPGHDEKLRDLHEGDVVRADTAKPLIQLDDSDYRRRVEASRDQLAQAKARLVATQASLKAVQSKFERIESLRPSGAVAQQNYDDALAARDAMVAELEGVRCAVSTAEVALRQAEDDLKNCSLRLPITEATVSRKYVENGERVPAGQPVLEVMDLSSVRVAFSVPDTKIKQFSLGQTLTVMADAFPNKQFVSRVSKILPAADLRTRSFEIEVTIDQPNGLRPGMIVSLTSGREQKMILLPMTAIGRGATPDETTVFVVKDEGGRTLAHRRVVDLDGVHDNRIRLIEGGTSQVGEGDVIVVTGAFRLSEGQEVRTLEVRDPALHVGL